MASRDLTASFIERRSAAALRRRTSLEAGPSSRMKPFGISKVGGGDGDDHLLMEDGMAMSPFDHGSSGLGAGGGGGGGGAIRSGGATAALPPQWVDDVDAVHEGLADITRLMGILASMHATRLGSVFGKDLDDMEGKIEKLTSDITDRFRHAERLLQRVGAATRRAGGEEATVGTNVQRSLAKKLQELSVEFRQKQRKYLSDVQAQKGVGLTEREAKFGIDLEKAQGGMGTDEFGFTTQQLSVVDDLEEAVKSRDQEIAKIAQSIEELGAIFKELAVLVIDQGTILDRIDYNMEAVVEHTREGIQQLEKAEKHQKSGRPMKCIMCLLCTICVLLIILVLKHRRALSWIF